jgi:pimeloyl-ACP methyl ester carboxylesterase
MDRPLDQFKNAPAPELKHLGIAEIAYHYAGIVRGLDKPPILIGHSFLGLITQLLLDRGLGVVGVAIDSGPPRGVLPAPGAVITTLAVLRSWMGWRKILSMSEGAFGSHVVPAPGRIFFQAAFGIATKFRYDNPDRAPLLFIAGGIDKTVPASMARSNYKIAKQAPSATELVEYVDRCHFQMAQAGWQDIAARIDNWIDSVGAGIDSNASAPATPIRRSSAATS